MKDKNSCSIYIEQNRNTFWRGLLTRQILGNEKPRQTDT